ncbi:MAG: hypothetical protein JWP07_5072, partial [Pseudonocardiales bacterium]|nr:hypothetical protein [Pseudonocardiales bacterium]
MFEPRTFTEADPISSVFFTDWADVPAPHEPQWSAPTYVGRRNLRPGTKPAAATIDAARGTTEAAADEGTSGLLATSRTMAVASLASRIT